MMAITPRRAAIRGLAVPAVSLALAGLAPAGTTVSGAGDSPPAVSRDGVANPAAIETPVPGAAPRAAATTETAGVPVPDFLPVRGPDVLRIVRETRAPAVLVNIWATWCIPCREEFPDLLRVFREHRDRGFRLVLVSADFPEDTGAARAFLGEQGAERIGSYLKTGDDMEFIDTLDRRWTGALPATFIYDSRGTLRHFWEGKASHQVIESKVREILGAIPAEPSAR